eukprot:ANDGO_07871.mRNA.1 Mitogen-activated protein kinase kinase kinase NPK1
MSRRSGAVSSSDEIEEDIRFGSDSHVSDAFSASASRYPPNKPPSREGGVIRAGSALSPRRPPSRESSNANANANTNASANANSNSNSNFNTNSNSNISFSSSSSLLASMSNNNVVHVNAQNITFSNSHSTGSNANNSVLVRQPSMSGSSGMITTPKTAPGKLLGAPNEFEIAAGEVSFMPSPGALQNMSQHGLVVKPSSRTQRALSFGNGNSGSSPPIGSGTGNSLLASRPVPPLALDKPPASQHQPQAGLVSSLSSSATTASVATTGSVVHNSNANQVQIVQPRPGSIPGENTPSSASGAPFPYQKGALIGQGSFGRVFLALNQQSGEFVAIKEITFSGSLPKIKAQLVSIQREISLLQKYRHPNVVRYLGSERIKSTLHIFLEYVPGGSIAQVIEQFGRLDETLVKMYTKQLVEGLQYLHQNRIVHRDIKAANVLLDCTSGTVKLADFGASTQISGMATMSKENFSFTGTPSHMAPEVILQTGHGRSADVWSLGCTVLEMVTGSPPWSQMLQGKNVVQALMQIAQAEGGPPLPSDLSPQLQSFLSACFVRDPKKRALVRDLASHPFLTESTPTSARGGQRSAVDKPPSARSLAGAVISPTPKSAQAAANVPMNRPSSSSSTSSSSVRGTPRSYAYSDNLPVVGDDDDNNDDDDGCVMVDSRAPFEDDEEFDMQPDEEPSFLDADDFADFNPVSEPSLGPGDHGATLIQRIQDMMKDSPTPVVVRSGTTDATEHSAASRAADQSTVTQYAQKLAQQIELKTTMRLKSDDSVSSQQGPFAQRPRALSNPNVGVGGTFHPPQPQQPQHSPPQPVPQQQLPTSTKPQLPQSQYLFHPQQLDNSQSRPRNAFGQHVEQQRAARHFQQQSSDSTVMFTNSLASTMSASSSVRDDPFFIGSPLTSDSLSQQQGSVVSQRLPPDDAVAMSTFGHKVRNIEEERRAQEINARRDENERLKREARESDLAQEVQSEYFQMYQRKEVRSPSSTTRPASRSKRP